MRILFAGFLLIATMLPCAAALAQDKDTTSGPTPEQLLHVPATTTHIPVQRTPQHYANPYANDKQALVEGKKLFNSMNCVGCHAPGGGGGMGPPLSDNDWIYGGQSDQMYLSIVQGRPNGMPAFGSILPSDSIWKIIAYIKTLNSTPVKHANQPE